MLRNILPIFIFLTAFAHIRAKYKLSTIQEYIFKPLTVLLIILVAFLGTTSGFYKNMIIIGLIFSLAGDIFLISKNKFIPGLISFLFAHLIYIVAFTNIAPVNFANRIIDNTPKWQLVMPFLIYGFIVYQYISDSLGKLKIPVAIYVSVILIMGISALNTYFRMDSPYRLLALIGAILFIISDSVLAINKFKIQFKSAELILLSTYYMAQLLIAFSIK